MRIEDKKELFKQYASCKHVEVTKDGRAKASSIEVELVCVDSDGNVLVQWRLPVWHSAKMSEVNAIDYADGDIAEGIFTSKKEAAAAAEEWFADKKKRRIAELEAELEALKASS